MQHWASQLEKIIKGAANSRRLMILKTLASEPGLPLWQISEKLHLNFKTAAGHTSRLLTAGLIEKKYAGQAVRHHLTPLGVNLLAHLENLKSVETSKA